MGPLFVDWTAYRAEFETRATAVLGQPVHVAGNADMRLLPIPTLDFTDVLIGPDPKRPMMRVGRFELEVELFPLLKGEVQVTDMRLDRPELTVRVDEKGTLAWIAGRAADPALDPSRVTLDNVEIHDGSVRIVDARRPAPIEVTAVNARLDARSLLGPYKLDGGMVVEGESVMVRASTGTLDADGSIVLKAALSPASRPIAISLDGRLSQAGGVPEWSGKAHVERVVAEDDRETTPWVADAAVDLNPQQLLAKDLAFRYGPEDRPFAITGATTVDLADPPYFDAVLSARQIDLDRTLGRGPDAPASLASVLAAFSAAVDTLPRPPIAGRVGFDIPGIVVGGGIVTDVRADLTLAEDGWTVETLEANLPGKTALVAEGDLTTEGALAFEGNVAVQSEQPSALVSWWAPERPKTGLAAFTARTRVTASAAGLALANLDATVAESRVTGEASFSPARSGRPPRIALALDAERLDLDQAEAVAGLVSGDGGVFAGGADLSVRLKAATATAGDTTARDLDVSASLADGTLAIDRLAVADLAGARVSASGTIRDVGSTPDGSIQARLSAEKLDDVAKLAAALAPGSEAARLLKTAAPVLAPATVEVTIEAKAAGEATAARIHLDGTAGGTTLSGALAFDGRVDRWREASIDLSTRLDGPNGVRLMRQLGVDVPDVEGAGVGSLSLTAKGRPAERLATAAEGNLGPTRFSVSGETRVPLDALPSADLKLSLASPDVGPILALSGNVLADVLASTPVDLSAQLAARGPRFTVDQLAGTVDGGPVSGDLALDFTPAVPALSGHLSLRAASLAGLGELALGPGTLEPPIVGGSRWPEAPFGPAPLDGLDTDLALSIGRLDLGAGLVADGLTLSLRASASGIGYDGVAARLAGGTLTGNLVVKRDLEGSAAVTGSLKLEGADAGALVWRDGDRPVVTGTASLDVEGSAGGRTVAGLVASLTGGGSFTVADGRIRSMNPNAFGAVIRAADAGKDLADDKILEIFTATVDAGDLPFRRIDGTFTLAGGTLRAPSIRIESPAAVITGTATVDLPHHSLSSDWTLTADSIERSAGSPPPQVALLFRGDLSAPVRKIDVAAFSNFLGIRSFERETQRVLVMQADILERELLSRSVLRGKEESERRRRADAAAEAARQAAEAARAAAAAKAAEAARTARPPAPAAPGPDDFTRQIQQRLQQIPPTTDNGSLPGVTVPDPLPPG